MFLMGKSTISMAIFNSLLYVYQAGSLPWSKHQTYGKSRGIPGIAGAIGAMDIH